MLDVGELFADASAGPPPTAGDLWNNHVEMKGWLDSVFDSILATPSDDTIEIAVPPYRFVHDGRNLFSVSLLSLFSLRPHGATITKQDFQYIFCDAFLDAIEFQAEETVAFTDWVAKMLLRVAQEEEFLDSAPADFIRDYLQYMAIHDPILARLRMIERYDFIPLFVSGVFAIHIGGFWPQLADRIEGRGRLQLKISFKLIEVFLNRFAEKELRFRSVTAEYVKEVMKLRDYGVSYPELAIEEATVLRVLRLVPEPPTRSIVKRIGEALGDAAVRAVGARWVYRRALADSVATVSRKRAHGVTKLEREDAA